MLSPVLSQQKHLFSPATICLFTYIVRLIFSQVTYIHSLNLVYGWTPETLVSVCNIGMNREEEG